MHAHAWGLTIAAVLLLTVAVVAMTVGGLDQRRDAVGAAVRAVVQLAGVALIIGTVFRYPLLGVAYLGVMLVAATLTATRRIGGQRRPWAVGASITSGALIGAAPMFFAGALAITARSALPILAQLLGGAMTATAMAGRRLHEDAQAHWPVIEGWVALGATLPRAARDTGRLAASRALIPALDQTRSVGLVVLPGSFVGLLLGGASPLQAGELQLLVLLGLLATETVAVVIAVRLLAGTVQPLPIT